MRIAEIGKPSGKRAAPNGSDRTPDNEGTRFPSETDYPQGSTGVTPRLGPIQPDDYSRLVQNIRRVVEAMLPPGAVVAVVSKGDSQLVEFRSQRGWHFPQQSNGDYAGFHPADSHGALQELDKLRAKGASFLVIPSTGFWWLDHYQAFGQHLETTHSRIWKDEHCVIYKITGGSYIPPKVQLIFSNHDSGGAANYRKLPGEAFRFAIDSRLPERLVVGEGTAFYVNGWCYHASSDIQKLELVCNGWISPVSSWRMPRPDVKAAHFPNLDPTGRSLQSGFWGLATIGKVTEEVEARVLLRATLTDGGRCEQVIGHMSLIPGNPYKTSVYENGSSETSARVTICMAAYNPPLGLFKRQIESIQRQTLKDWVCIITDDGSRPDLFESAHRVVKSDSRFRLHRSQTGLGFYHNFERCLSLVPRSTEFIALSDHDDFWHPDKLETLVQHFNEGTSLVYSDMRIVTEIGQEISPTYWTTRPNNYTRFDSLLMANTITGGACMFRRSLLPLILPFPERVGEAYHDHWIGAVALAVGDIRYVDRALYDYVQHGANVIGHFAPKKPMAFLPDSVSIRKPRRILVEAFRFWERVYFADLLRLQLMTEILRLRCGNRVSPEKAKELTRLSKLGTSWRELVWLASRALAGRNRVTETINVERPLLGAALWRHSARSRWHQKIVGPARHSPATHSRPAPPPQTHDSVEMIRAKIAPLRLNISATAPKRLNLLIPTIDLKYFFGGYITKFNLARQLAQDGHKVRVVIVDHCNWQPDVWRAQFKKFKGLESFFDSAEVAYAYDRARPLEVHSQDVFMATTWWTAHIAHAAAKDLGAPGFVYLIQEYEPFTFAMGSLAALANQSYEFPHYAVFSTDLLRTYFQQNQLGVFAAPRAGSSRSVAFENAITNVGDITVEDLSARTSKRLLYYARPEPHAARNMFELGVLGLSAAIEEGCFDDTWEFYGIGSLGSAQKLSLSRGRSLILLPRETQDAYREILRAHDVGLALMHTPHPSLVPIEMASAGMLVVTTTFGNKTQAELSKISPNLIAAHPSIDEIKLGLKTAAARVSDYTARARGAKVHWAKTWEAAFNAPLRAEIQRFIRACETGAERHNDTSAPAERARPF